MLSGEGEGTINIGSSIYQQVNTLVIHVRVLIKLIGYAVAHL